MYIMAKKSVGQKAKLNEDETDEDIEEIENPYTVTNRAISELVTPKDTMYYLTGNQIPLILTAHEFANLR